jgi:acetyltransferase-like isoleucine patch superfamily enzyme
MFNPFGKKTTKPQLLLLELRNLISIPLTIRHLKEQNLLSVGVGTYGKPRIYFWDDKTRLTIGNYCSIAADVTIILGGNHRLDWVTTFPFTEFSQVWSAASGISGHPSTKGDIEIGHDVWIGNGVTVLSGVKIGNGAVIGAGSVISQDIPPYAVAAGNPAKVLRFRFDRETIDYLDNLAWWDWDKEKINANMEWLLAPPKLFQIPRSN